LMQTISVHIGMVSITLSSVKIKHNALSEGFL